ncbi:MAG: HAD family hydrolase [Gammaproteobacteria bacterium]|nr:HAD family hydrolase [Gammaproteobacteria bacterium]NNF50607.1 HAD family hydrolase [Woeseiaceae bacterium]MBT8094044.1 HAD family hydrolase [Gammaproteobacteria bacterium]MBT8105703.1 HAD family hydrolase [Gammaproteobacteria bacterium]NNK25717.1 HAD family hydrolase [Woeseiaceae bacterium]
MRAVLFDIDGTLLHSAAIDDALYREAVRVVLGDVQLRPSLHEYEFVTDTGVLRQILRDNDIDENERTLEGIRTVFVDLLEAHVHEHGPFREIPGARQMLRALQASPACAVAMATGGWRQSAVLKLASARMHYEDIPLATSNDHHERTTIMEIALERLGGSFESVTYFGDGPWDREACARLGWEFVAVGPELGGLEHFHGVDPCS